jgi:hypothetical protein
VRDGQVGFVPLAGLPAVHPGVVGAGAGVAGLPLEVAEPGVDGLPDHVVDLADQGRPVPVAVLIPCLAAQAGILAEGGVEDRDRLGQRDRQVEEQRALPGLLDGLGAELALALGGGVRLGSQQLRVYELWKAIGPGHEEAWQYGYISGKLATLRWVLGSEWDFLDT